MSRVIEGAELPAPRNASPGLAAVILKACMADPDRRYESADAMKEDLFALAAEREPRHSMPLWKKAVLAAAALVILACVYLFLLKPAPETEWSAWSEWSETVPEVTDPDRIQTEAKEQYEWSAVRCADCSAYNPADSTVCRVCKEPLPAGSEILKKYTDDSVSEVMDGQPGVRKFENSPYWYSGMVTRYRYRTRDPLEEEKEPSAEDVFCHDWYFATYEDSEQYPGIVFAADGSGQHFSVTAGERMYLIDSRNGQQASQKEASVEDGVLTAGFEKFTLEDGKLVRRYGAVTETYTREPPERQIPEDRSAQYADALKPEHFNGTWTIVKYGINNAFIDAEAMNLAGKAVIRDGKITLTWTRDGQEKSFELQFDEALNNGRLYTVVNDSVSYIVTMRADHTILLNVGLNQAQWVMRKEPVISEEVVHPEAPDFERDFAAREDWTATEEDRKELAELLIGTAEANGVDPAAVRADGPAFLALISRDPAYPMLVCEGAGAYENYILTVGRGVSAETGAPFVYYQWTDCFFSSLAHPEESVAEYYRNEILLMTSGEKIWPVRIGTE